LVSFSGGIAPDKNGKPVVHAHVVVALPDGSTKAGHVFEGHIGITMDVFIIDAGDGAAKTGQ
jgi:predicted DNA-binding protein with PD1-like motif